MLTIFVYLAPNSSSGRLFLMLFFVSSFSACTDDCADAEPIPRTLNLQFARREDRRIVRAALDIRATSVPGSPQVAKNTDTLTSHPLGIPAGDSSIVYSLRGSAGGIPITATLAIGYNRRIEVIFPECGVRERINELRNLSSITTLPDSSVVILNGDINEDLTKIHVQILVDQE